MASNKDIVAVGFLSLLIYLVVIFLIIATIASAVLLVLHLFGVL